MHSFREGLHSLREGLHSLREGLGRVSLAVIACKVSRARRSRIAPLFCLGGEEEAHVPAGKGRRRGGGLSGGVLCAAPRASQAAWMPLMPSKCDLEWVRSPALTFAFAPQKGLWLQGWLQRDEGRPVAPLKLGRSPPPAPRSFGRYVYAQGWLQRDEGRS